MVTLVYDADGNELHNCIRERCTVSWDGFLIATGVAAVNRIAVNLTVWNVSGNTAKLKA